MAILKSSASTSRRALLATSLGAAGTGLLAASIIATDTAEAAVIDPHPAWLERYLAAWDAFDDIYGHLEDIPENFEANALLDEACRLSRLIMKTPARTSAGAAAQLRLFAERSAELSYDPDGRVMLTRIVTLLETREV